MTKKILIKGDPGVGPGGWMDERPSTPALFLVPLILSEANELVAKLHRHHKPCRGHRFSLGAVDTFGQLRGAVICGRPVSRNFDFQAVLEVTRLVTDGTHNLPSALYGAAARVAKEMGFEQIQTYTLEEEPGTSLRAANWVDKGLTTGGQWKRSDGKPRRTDQPITRKRRWALELVAKADLW